MLPTRWCVMAATLPGRTVSHWKQMQQIAPPLRCVLIGYSLLNGVDMMRLIWYLATAVLLIIIDFGSQGATSHYCGLYFVASLSTVSFRFISLRLCYFRHIELIDHIADRALFLEGVRSSLTLLLSHYRPAISPLASAHNTISLPLRQHRETITFTYRVVETPNTDIGHSKYWRKRRFKRFTLIGFQYAFSMTFACFCHVRSAAVQSITPMLLTALTLIFCLPHTCSSHVPALKWVFCPLLSAFSKCCMTLR